MTSQQIQQADFLDILFDGRNKAYGAYRLRREYPRAMRKALALAALPAALLFFLAAPGTSEMRTTTPKEEYKLTQVVIPETPKPEAPRPAATPAAPAARTEVLITNMKVVELTPDPVATQSDLQQSLVGSDRSDGPAATGLQPPPLPPADGAGTATEPAAEKPEPPLPSRQPEFPGGSAAWLRFLERHLQPPADLEPGERRSVAVRFSVDEEGVVTRFQVVQSGGAAFDAEVIRVLKKMPRWLPAIQNGKPLAVSFTQPVVFVAPE